jgi:prepilin-type N-terminal cleavage/methylation domain-containing protein
MCNAFQKKNTDRHEAGFTLIELMVSVSIFSIVLMLALGTMLTILDSNRKARTLTEVMNNVNFSLENITRSMKTGVEPKIENGALTVTAIILEQDVTGDRFRREQIEYRCVDCDSRDERGVIERRDGGTGGTWIPITSDMVDVNKFEFEVAGIADPKQPRTLVLIEGDVRVNDKINSSFSVQTTISQRKLNLVGREDL